MVAIDLTCIAREEVEIKSFFSGIGTFVAEILDTIIEQNAQKEYVLIINFYVKKFISERFPGFETVCLGGALSRLIYSILGKSTEMILKESGYNTWKINRCNKISGVWFPFGVPEIVYPCKCETILTIHDFMTCKEESGRQKFEKMICNADKIVVISNYVRRQYRDYVSTRKDKIPAVIPNSIKYIKSGVKRVEGVRTPFILDINRYVDHKNPITLLKAFEYYLNKTSDKTMQLVFCGFGKLEIIEELKQYVTGKRYEGRVFFLQKVTVEEREWLLQNAELFVTPSVDEGFGRTPLEAMLRCVPVISTRETALPEATMGLAIYYDNPYDFQELGNVMIQTLHNKPSREKLEEISEIVKKTYSPERILKRYVEVFHS